MALALLLIPAPTPASWTLPAAGVVLTAAGEALRLWAVRHIGAISRTRSDRLGPLISTGPFALVRNPLYIGNILIWVGFTLTAQLAWLASLVAALLFAEYNAIVRWEEALLESRLGHAYREYAARVPRWMPKSVPPVQPLPSLQPWTSVLFSERGTLIALAAGFALLWLRAHS